MNDEDYSYEVTSYFASSIHPLVNFLMFYTLKAIHGNSGYQIPQWLVFLWTIVSGAWGATSLQVS